MRSRGRTTRRLGRADHFHRTGRGQGGPESRRRCSPQSVASRNRRRGPSSGPLARGAQESTGPIRSRATIPKVHRHGRRLRVRFPMSAVDEYNGIWDMFVQMHRQTHGEKHVPTRDFNGCGEYAVLMALRAASTLKPDYPHHLLLRLGAMQELDRDFYVKNILSTDGEPEPADPEPLREYRAARRYHILWTELKEAAARISDLEGALKAGEDRIAELQGELRKARVPEETAAGKA